MLGDKFSSSKNQSSLLSQQATIGSNSSLSSPSNVATKNGNKITIDTSSSPFFKDTSSKYTEKVAEWNVSDVSLWLKSNGPFSISVRNWIGTEEIDGKVLLALSENDIRDIRYRLNYDVPIGELKKLWLLIYELQERYFSTKAQINGAAGGIINNQCLLNGTYPLLYSNPSILSSPNNIETTTPVHRRTMTTTDMLSCYHHNCDSHTGGGGNACLVLTSSEYIPTTPATVGGDSDTAATPPMSIDDRAANIPPDFFKTFISLGYSFLVTWITSFVMVIVHERVPDMKRYPPLPDIFLDNVPHIPWAFHMCEITGTLLFAIWSCVCIFHKYRMVLLRRFFALAGTVFLLRCVTMLITSLSVPGTHLQCDQNDYAVDDTELTLTEALKLRISRAYTIWSGLGMSIQGVRTCGDYMFSGHTVALTLLNFFITEYTPRNLYFLHTLTWLLNMFGIFFILAAHEHYSIDVFVAFYITSRLFLYYHTLANNQALMSRDSTRTRIWFPMFSYFESSVYGIIPNEFDTLSSLFDGFLSGLMDFKDSIMMTAHRLFVNPPHLAVATKKLFLHVNFKKQRHASTSTQSGINMGLSAAPPPTSSMVCTDTTEVAAAAAAVASLPSIEFESISSVENRAFYRSKPKSSSSSLSSSSSSNNLNNNETLSFMKNQSTDNNNKKNAQALAENETKKIL